MSTLVRSSAAVAVTGFTIAAFTAAPGPLAQPHPIVSPDIRLAAATPPGGLITSFLGNQLLYCSLICTSAIQGVATVTGVALQTPGTFFVALQSGDVLKAIGVTAASVTGAADAAAEDVFFKDGMEVAPRAVNALEVGVVGLLNVIPAVAGGLPAVLTALETARDDTFTALNLPIVPNPTPTVMPHGVLEVATVGAINIATAVFVPALNDVLLGAFQVPDAIAKTLADTGNPLRALAAGAATVATIAANATGAIATSVRTAVTNVRNAIGPNQKATTATTPAPVKVGSSNRLVSTTQHTAVAPSNLRPAPTAVSKAGPTASTVAKKTTAGPHVSNSPQRHKHSHS
jgi:hypothetical protein